MECQAFQSGALAEVATFLSSFQPCPSTLAYSSLSFFLFLYPCTSLPAPPVAPPYFSPSVPRTVLQPVPPSPWTTGRLAWAGASSRCCSQLVETLSSLGQVCFRVTQGPQDGSPCTATNTGGCSYSYSYRLDVTSAGTFLPPPSPPVPCPGSPPVLWVVLHTSGGQTQKCQDIVMPLR